MGILGSTKPMEFLKLLFLERKIALRGDCVKDTECKKLGILNDSTRATCDKMLFWSIIIGNDAVKHVCKEGDGPGRLKTRR